MRDLSIFRSLVKREVKFIREDKFLDSDDIEQECWLKIWSILPKFTHIPEVELKAIVSTSLINHRKDMFRKNRTREHINVSFNFPSNNSGNSSGSEESSTLEDNIITNNNISFLGSVPAHLISPEQYASYSGLVDELIEWSNGQCGLTQKVVKALVDPDDQFLKEWHDSIKDNVSRYRYYHYIPPSSLAKHFGVSKLTISRVVKKIRLFLIDSDLVSQKDVKQYDKYYQEWRNATN